MNKDGVVETSNEYHVNMFKMKSPYARANSRMIIVTILIWITAVLGFQFLLWAIEKPVPEKGYVTFSEFHPSVSSGTVTKEGRAQYARSILMTIAKNPASADKAKLMESFHYAIKGMVPAQLFASKDKLKVAGAVAGQMGVGENSLEAKILPYIIDLNTTPRLNVDTQKVMAKYLIHNRSFLTDTKFLGFPFHYWYTAEFLLILFVVLCWIYCMRINTLQKKFNIKDE